MNGWCSHVDLRTCCPLAHSQYPEAPAGTTSPQPLSNAASRGPSGLQPPVWRHARQVCCAATATASKLNTMMVSPSAVAEGGGSAAGGGRRHKSRARSVCYSIVNVRFVPGATWDVSYRTCAAHTLHAAGATWDEWTCGVTVVVSHKNEVVFTSLFTTRRRVRGGSFSRAHLLLEHKGARRCHLGASALPNATWKK